MDKTILKTRFSYLATPVRIRAEEEKPPPPPPPPPERRDIPPTKPEPLIKGFPDKDTIPPPPPPPEKE